MKTLFISREVPYPVSGGVALRNWQNINALIKQGPVALFTASNWTPKQTTLPGITRWHHSNVELQRTNLENLERRLWWAHPNRHPDADWAYSHQAAQELDELLRDFQPDIVIFEEVWLHRYLSIVKKYCSNIIFDNHNVEYALAQQNLKSLCGFKGNIKKRLLLNHTKNIELNMLKN